MSCRLPMANEMRSFDVLGFAMGLLQGMFGFKLAGADELYDQTEASRQSPKAMTSPHVAAAAPRNDMHASANSSQDESVFLTGQP